MAGLLDGFDLTPMLRESKQLTDQSMQKVTSDSLPPLDVTTSRLDEGIALVNPNDTAVASRITNYKTQVVSQLSGIIGSIAGGVLNPKTLGKMIKIGPNGVRFDTDDLISAVGGSLGFNVYGKAGALQAIANGVTGEFARLTGLNIDDVLVSDGTGFAINQDWRSQVGMQTLNMVREFTGADEYLDVSVQTSLYNSVLYSAGSFGMKDSYDKLWENYPYPPLRQDAFIEALKTMIANGDVESIDKVISLLDQQGKNVLLNKYPTFVETLFRSFHFNNKVYPEDYPALRDKVLGILNIVIGPGWYYRNTQFGRAYNLGIVSQISEDMVTLLSSVEELIPLLCCRGMFAQGSALSALDNSFPDAPINML